MFFFFQAEDGIRDLTVTGVQTCALPISHPARDRRGLAVPRVHHGVPIGGEARLAFRELVESAEREPRLVTRPALARDGREDVAHDRYAQQRGDDRVEADPEPREEHPSRQSVGPGHWSPPTTRCGRFAASHATTSETSSDESGLPGTSPRQSGAPSSGRPTMTVVRKP